MTKTMSKTPSKALTGAEPDGAGQEAARGADGIDFAAQLAGSSAVDRQAGAPYNNARQAASANTLKAYAGDWTHFARWCRMCGADPQSPRPELIGRYISDLAAPGGKGPALSVASIKRRLSGLVWGYAQRGLTLDRKDRHIATVLAGIRRKPARPPAQKVAILPEDLHAMLATLPHDLRGLRDRAILLIGYAGELRRSEIVSLNLGHDAAPGSVGWVEILESGVLITLRSKTGWRKVEVARGTSEQTCPVHALCQWLRFAKIDFGPIFVAVARNGLRATEARLSDKHVARLIKQTVQKAGLRPELSQADRLQLYSGHSLRTGLASSAQIEEPVVQKRLGHG